MKILVTGATGYVGQNFIPKLLQIFPELEILTVNLSVEEANTLFPFQQCKHISTQEMAFIQDFNPHLVYHLATLSTSRNDEAIIHPMLQANIEFGVKLLHHLSFCSNLQLFVNIGSFAEYNQGTQKISNSYLYSATKSAFRQFVEYYAVLSGYKAIHLVPYSLYGGKDTAKKIIDYIRESFDSETPVKMSKGEQILDFTHVQDLVFFFLLIIKQLDRFLLFPVGEEFHIGTGTGTSIRDLAKKMEKVFGKQCNADWGGIPYRPLDTMYAVAPIEKNIKLLNWKTAISLDEGLEMYKEAHIKTIRTIPPELL
ncbi:MAG: NAD(P)-dependent oxidoreductase [Bacteroidetes bacterium]|nr:NAD(P)-dependent oxidoreductase [Bacteroidota bacterium]MCL1968102.1 NAD(P)-dependent oxidoreductase [Bacteroidota bacterium]